MVCVNNISIFLSEKLRFCFRLMYQMFFVPIISAMTMQLGRLLGAQKIDLAYNTFKISVYFGLGLAVICSVAIYFLNYFISATFTHDENIIYRVQTLAPYVALFQFMYMCQGCTLGALRAFGMHFEVAGYECELYTVLFQSN
jgi:Na+-driven multidrug efflux pump